jgi:hypothetical protein
MAGERVFSVGADFPGADFVDVGCTTFDADASLIRSWEDTRWLPHPQPAVSTDAGLRDES